MVPILNDGFRQTPGERNAPPPYFCVPIQLSVVPLLRANFTSTDSQESISKGAPTYLHVPTTLSVGPPLTDTFSNTDCSEF